LSPPADQLPVDASRPGPVHGQQRQAKRQHPVAEYWQKSQHPATSKENADRLAQPVVRVGLEILEVAIHELLQADGPEDAESPLFQVYLASGKR
jgi:hypothetical protein